MEYIRLEKISILSYKICYGQKPDREDEVEQQLMITTDGKVSFRAFCFGDGFDQFTEGRKLDCTIEQEQAQIILQSIADLLQSPGMEPDMEDGIWTIQGITQTGETYEKEGALTDVFINGESLTQKICEKLPIGKLWIFGEAVQVYNSIDSAVTLDDFPKG